MKIGVVGAGVMGGGIAQVCAIAGDDVVVYDTDADAALARITFSSSFADAAATDLVIEAVPERLDVKMRVFRDLDRAAPPHTVLASNTSGLPITALAGATERPDKVIGWHWASPAPVMKLAEIVVTPQTSDATIATVTDAATRAGKHPIVVKDNPMHWGFVSNRVYFAMVAEAQRVVDEGVATRDEVDQLMIDCFRWPSGPFGMVKGAGSGWS
jgi:3-hydroxyacyl-CoA dehydrogenase